MSERLSVVLALLGIALGFGITGSIDKRVAEAEQAPFIIEHRVVESVADQLPDGGPVSFAVLPLTSERETQHK